MAGEYSSVEVADGLCVAVLLCATRLVVLQKGRRSGSGVDAGSSQARGGPADSDPRLSATADGCGTEGMSIFGCGSGGPGVIEFVGVVRELAVAVAELVCRAHRTDA